MWTLNCFWLKSIFEPNFSNSSSTNLLFWIVISFCCNPFWADRRVTKTCDHQTASQAAKPHHTGHICVFCLLWMGVGNWQLAVSSSKPSFAFVHIFVLSCSDEIACKHPHLLRFDMSKISLSKTEDTLSAKLHRQFPIPGVYELIFMLHDVM